MTTYQQTVSCTLDDGSKIDVVVKYGGVLMAIFPDPAVTLWNTVHAKNFSGAVLDAQSLNHELEHVRQWHRLGRVKFAVTYLWYQLRYGYNKNPLEQEARQVSGQPLR